MAAAVAMAAHHEHHQQRTFEDNKQEENSRGVYESALGFVGGRCASRTAIKITAPRATTQMPIIKVIQSQSQPSTQVCMAPPFS
jgi:hypothetical protein